jgi:hypothetical protein
LRSKSLQLVNGITPEKIDKAGAGELAKSSTMLLQRARDLEGTGARKYQTPYQNYPNVLNANRLRDIRYIMRQSLELQHNSWQVIR